MFGFEKLEVYQIAHRQYLRQGEILQLIKVNDLNTLVVNQLKEFSLNIILQFTIGSSAIENQEKKKYYTSSRSLVFQSVACLIILRDRQSISQEQFDELYELHESLSRMMLSLVRNMSNNKSGGGRHNNKNTNSNNSGRHNSKSVSSTTEVENLSKEGSFGLGLDDEYKDFNKLNIGE